MKTLVSFMVAAGIAALIAGFFAAIPALFVPAYTLWVVLMLLLISVFEYRSRVDRHHY